MSEDRSDGGRDRGRAGPALARVDRLLQDLVDSGLERISAAGVAEIRELSRTVHHARLIRLERELAALATLAERYLGRDPSFSFRGWVAGCARVRSLAVAARRVLDGGPGDPDEVLGVPRRTYERLDGTLEVLALGAAGWVADSGFVGVTVYLWDPAARRVLQATVARPTSLVGPDPRRLLFAPVSEITLLTAQELAHGAWVLDDVRLSSDGRISLHAGLHTAPAPPRGARAYEAFACEGVAAVIERCAERELDPIGGGAGTLALVPIARVRQVGTDDTAARGYAELVDPAGAAMRVSVPLRAHHDLLLENLARLERAAPAAMFGFARVVGGEVLFEPVTALFDAPVRLALRRPIEVLEVHLGLEPMSAPVTVPAARRPPPPPPPAARREIERALAAIDVVVERLFGGGVGVADAATAAELGVLADEWAAAGVVGLPDRLRALAEGLVAGSAHEPLHALVGWLRAFRVGLGLELARASVGSAAPAPRVGRGEDLVVVPIGAELVGTRLRIHGIDAAERRPVVLEDELLGVDPLDPLDAPVPSKLFQDRVVLREVLQREVVLRDHPVERAPGKRVVRPAFHAAARSGERVEVGPLPSAPGSAPFRASARARRDPDGWILDVPGLDPTRVDDERLQLDLEKRSADGAALDVELCGVLRRDELVVLSVDGLWPTLDPRATRWSPDRLRRAGDRALDALVDALGGGPLPGAPPGPAIDADTVADRAEALVAAVRRGGVLPEVGELWAVGEALAAAGRAVAGGGPIRALGLPRARVWLACAGPLAAWLRGDRPRDRRVDEALLLAIGAGEGDVLVSPARGRL